MVIRDKKHAMVTVELAVSLVLVAAVLLVTLGVFGNNLQTLFTASKFKNVFNNNDIKTKFAQWSSTYSDSNTQVEVQLMGEQGLSMLRKEANDYNLHAIKGIFDANPNKKHIDLKTTDDSIMYFANLIYTIVGDSSICSEELPKESYEKCSALNLKARFIFNNLSNNATITDTYTDKTITFSSDGNNFIPNGHNGVRTCTSSGDCTINTIETINLIVNQIGLPSNPSEDASKIIGDLDKFVTDLADALKAADDNIENIGIKSVPDDPVAKDIVADLNIVTSNMIRNNHICRPENFAKRIRMLLEQRCRPSVTKRDLKAYKILLENYGLHINSAFNNSGISPNCATDASGAIPQACANDENRMSYERKIINDLWTDSESGKQTQYSGPTKNCGKTGNLLRCIEEDRYDGPQHSCRILLEALTGTVNNHALGISLNPNDCKAVNSETR